MSRGQILDKWLVIDVWEVEKTTVEEVHIFHGPSKGVLDWDDEGLKDLEWYPCFDDNAIQFLESNSLVGG